MVRSGKLNGFELIDCPLILVTLIEAAGVVGRFKGKGVDRNWEPEETLGPPRLFDSKRARPVPPGPSLAELLQQGFPPPTETLPVVPIVFATSRTAPPAPAPPPQALLHVNPPPTAVMTPEPPMIIVVELAIR